MKNINFLFSFLAFGVLLFTFAACGDDDSEEPSVDPVVGVYTLTSVTLNEDVVYYDQELSMGDDITVIVQTALYGASPCAQGPNTVIDLRENSEVYYACKNENVDAERFGTWSIPADRSRLTMNLTIEGQPFPLILEQLSVTDNAVSGVVTNYPLVELYPGGDPAFVIKTVEVDLVFSRTTL